LGQDFTNWELIVIDGGSSDGTVEILEKYDRHITYWVSEPDHGIYHAWNKALKQAKGEWVIFLGADDYLMDANALGDMSVHLRGAFPDYRVVYGKVLQVDRSGSPIRVLGEPWGRVRDRCRVHMSIPHPATFQHRSLFSENGYFCEDFSIAGDYEFLLRELPERPALFVENVTVTGMQVGGAGASPANNLKMLRESQLARKMRGRSSLTAYYPAAYARNYLRMTIVKFLGESNSRKLLDLWRRLTGRKPYWTKL